ncbi:MAG TPA: hypothetical protein DEH02_10970 [Bacteroidales bacterium]|nr:hypothetical protein [Bacteroidales bacterium]
MRDEIEDLPIYKQAKEVLKVTEAIVAGIDEEKDMLQIRDQMLANAYMLGPKIAGAEGGGLYSIRMDNAVIIKLNARELRSMTYMLEAEELVSPDYIKVLRDEIEKFRILFLEWVNSFDKEEDIEDDEWGFHW